MPKASLSGAEVDALLFGGVRVSSPEEQGATASGRPWRYPAWPSMPTAAVTAMAR